jgi:hypothetical protein
MTSTIQIILFIIVTFVSNTVFPTSEMLVGLVAIIIFEVCWFRRAFNRTKEEREMYENGL